MEISGDRQTIITASPETTPQPPQYTQETLRHLAQQALYGSDRWLCGGKDPTRLPASVVTPCDAPMAERLAWRRQCEIPITAAKALGTFLVMSGMRSSQNACRFIEIPTGIAVGTLAILVETYLRTTSGNELSDLINAHTPRSSYSKNALEAEMMKAGISFDYTDIDNLARATSQQERGEHGTFGALSFVPIAASAATLPPQFALPIVGLGTVGATTAGRCLRKRFAGRRLHSSIARITRDPDWQRDSNARHATTLVINRALSIVPSAAAQLATMIPGLWSPQAYGAIGDGLRPVAAANETEYYKLQAIDTIKAVTTFFEILNRPPYIFTDSRLAEHCGTSHEDPSVTESICAPYQKAIELDNLVPHAFAGEATLEPVSVMAHPGKPVLLSGRNGLGKSNLLRAIRHGLDHTGAIRLTEDGTTYNLHTLGARGHDAIDSKIALISRDLLPTAQAIADLFITVFAETHQSLLQRHIAEHPEHESKLRVAYYDVPEEKLAKALTEGQRAKGCTTFPRDILPALCELSEARHAWLADEVRRFGSAVKPIANKDVTSGLGPLSDGQKAAAINLLAALYAPLRVAVLLDEPTANLDRSMIASTHTLLQYICEQTSLVIISHENQEDLRAALPNCETVELRARS